MTTFFRMHTFLPWKRMCFRKSEKQEEHSMVEFYRYNNYYTLVILFYYLACPRGHPYYVGEVGLS